MEQELKSKIAWWATVLAVLAIVGAALIERGVIPDPATSLIDFLNSNSGAVIALASVVTAGATVALVYLARANWHLYQIERERHEANEYDVASIMSSSSTVVWQAIAAWKSYQKEPEDGKKEELFREAVRKSSRAADAAQASLPKLRKRAVSASTMSVIDAAYTCAVNVETDLPEDAEERPGSDDFVEPLLTSLQGLRTFLQAPLKKLT